MLTPFLIFATSCLPPTVINITKFPWNDHDKKMMKYATERCEQLYTDAPCLGLFKKIGEQDYTVLCRAEENE